MPEKDTHTAPMGATLSQRDREFLADFLDAMCVELLALDGEVSATKVSEVSTALKLDADGVWVTLAAREASAANAWQHDVLAGLEARAESCRAMIEAHPNATVADTARRHGKAQAYAHAAEMLRDALEGGR
jgi:hypothetical protein